MKTLFLTLFCGFIWVGCHAENNKLKVLHLSFHKGCVKEIEAVAKKTAIDLHTWYIPDLQPYYLDGETRGNALYNIGHDRAEKIWNQHSDFFESFDVILTSDTAPLCRIFLQNGWEKPLIIWICDRFDYFDAASLDCEFPDQEYYDLFEKASKAENVTMVAYTAFERYYAETKGIDIGTLLIKPCSYDKPIVKQSSIPKNINKKETFFLPPYHNEKEFMNFSTFCKNLGINNFTGFYNGPYDLKDFKGIIHLPYAWSNLALFENISLGIPYFVPSIAFLKELILQKNYHHQSPHLLINDDLYHLSEWYCLENQDFFIYFDSWDDLKSKINNTDYQNIREKIEKKAFLDQMIMLNRWEQVFWK